MAGRRNAARRLKHASFDGELFQRRSVTIHCWDKKSDMEHPMSDVTKALPDRSPEG
jgi:hypothetical protein